MSPAFNYLDWYGPAQMAVPADFRNVTIRVFPLKAPYPLVEKIVDGCLNIAPPGTLDFEVKPIGSSDTVVFLQVLDYGSMSSRVMPHKNWGYLSQKELFFAIPVFFWRKGKPENPSLFVPYCFVSNFWSALGGTAVLGYPKMLASFELPPDVQNPYPFHIKSDVFVHHNPGTPLTPEVVLRAKENVNPPPWQAPGLDPRRLWPFGPIDELFRPLDIRESELDLLKAASVSGKHNVIQLKQFRDIQSPALACYAALAGGNMKLEAFRGGGFLKPAEIEIFKYDSLKICETLGLYNTGGTVHPILPFWMDCDFSFLDPKNLYVAPPPP